MKVLLINGSPHVDGCTNRALVEIAGTLQAEGIESEIFHIGTKPIRGCMGCGMCRKNKLGRCIFGEDTVNVAIAKMEECDGLIVGGPTHYAAACGGITSFMDRLFYSTDGFPNKPAAAIATCRRAGSTTALDQLNKYFTISNMMVVGSAYWNMVYGNTPEEIEQDVEGLMVMRTLARNMAWLLKSIELGRQAGLELPKQEKKVRMNFIRKVESPYKDYPKYFVERDEK